MTWQIQTRDCVNVITTKMRACLHKKLAGEGVWGQRVCSWKNGTVQVKEGLS